MVTTPTTLRCDILFLIRAFYDYDGDSRISNGLKKSAAFVVDMLTREGFSAKMEIAIDGNCIDRLVTEAKAKIVILEAIWVTPEKMAELRRLHPRVRWIVRVHSELPFLSNEGMSIGWLAAYARLGVHVAFNSDRTCHDFSLIAPSLYLPNYYPPRKLRGDGPTDCELNIGCFGAIRPMKNQLIQAFAAVRYARKVDRKLTFHMNGTRKEQGGDNNLKSIQALMDATGNQLALHPWMDHPLFLQLIREMNLCLQVSLSESFNIVSADAVGMGVPLIGSLAITWLPKRSRIDPCNMDAIVEAMLQADDALVALNHDHLQRYCEDAIGVWTSTLEGWL